ncbi:MAG: LLM class flavin-dependent oxidoreductase [Pseudomonadales bacterium]|nr:LLM class flavin-dependent oxidoreductase [Pseudomonadales bacterium]
MTVSNKPTSTPLHIALTPWHLDKSGHAEDLVRQAEVAEDLGFHSFWLPENHFGDERSLPSPLTTLAAVAGRTRRIGLGTTSYLLPIRHPIQAAEEVAVLDRLSGGRLILGVGRGVQPAMFDVFDIDTREKRRHFRDNLAIMTDAWQGKPIRYHEGEPVLLSPLPVQQPHPPIWIAAFGPLALKQAGQLGAPYLASPVETLAQLISNYERHEQFAREAGHSINIRPVMRTVFISEKPAEVNAVREALAGSGSHAMRGENVDVADWTLLGSLEQVSEQIAHHQQVLGMTHLIARGRLPGVSGPQWMRSLEALATLQQAEGKSA